MCRRREDPAFHEQCLLSAASPRISHGPTCCAAGRADGAGLWDGQEASATAKESREPRAAASSGVGTENAASSGPLTDAQVLAARNAVHGADGSPQVPEVSSCEAGLS